MQQPKENKMGYLPIRPLVLSMSLPIMLSMLVQALYNVVDSIFLAKYSEDALTAVSLAFPIQMLIIAIAVGTAIGMNALLSRRLGERRWEEVNQVAENGMFLALCSTAAFALFGIFGVKPFFHAFVDEGAILEMGIAYTSLVSIGSVGIFVTIILERMLQATGRSFYSMMGQLLGAVVNIILDPIFIFGLWGFPKMGATGAAIATLLGQIASMLLLLFLNHTQNHEVTLCWRGFRPNGRIIRDIYRVGLPSIFMQSIGSIMTFGMNKILITFGQTVVSVFGIYFKLQSFVFMPVFGLTNGIVPIIGYNFGARNKERILSTIRFSGVLAVSIMLGGVLLFQFGSGFVLRELFFASPEMLEVGVPALRTISLSFPFAGVIIVLSSSFQALAKGSYSLFLSAFRQLVLLLPLAYLLGKFVSLRAVWFSFPIAEVCAFGTAIFLFACIYRDRIAPLAEPQEE